MANIYKSNYTGSQVDDAIGKVVNGKLQEKLTAGNNISISGNTISATVPTIPSITIKDEAATTPTSDIVAVISGETASGHTITNTKVNVATQAYVDKKSVAAVQYLGTVSNTNELAEKNPDNVGDFCRVAAAFGSYHAGDLLLCKTLKTASAAATWDVIHGELDKDTWTANSKTAAGYVAAGESNANKVWKTDASGNPAWRDDANTDTNTAHTHTVGSGLSIEGSGDISGNVKYSLKVASSSEIGGVKPGTTSGKTYGVAVAADGAMSVSVPWENNTDSKVTSAANHYTPSAESTAQLSVDASSTTAATWNSTSLVTGVNIQRDSKGHVTGVTVDSIKMPGNPDTGITSVEVTGTGNAITSASVSGRKMTLTKGSTFALITDIPSTSSFATLLGDNTFIGSNTFAKNVTFGDMHAYTRNAVSTYGAIEFFNGVYSCGQLVTDNENNDKNLTYKYYNAVVKFPKKTGTLATTDDIPEANPTAEGTVALTKLKIGDTVYNLPSGGGSGDVTAAGNNYFSGENTFTKKVIFSSLTESADFVGKPSFKAGIEITAGAVTSGNKTFNLPNKSGTFALTSDIPDTSNFVTLSGAQTISGNKTFTGNNTFTGVNTFNSTLTCAKGIATSTIFVSGGYTLTAPKKDGTLALTSDVVANPTAPGTTALARLKVGSIIYNLPSGGSGGGGTKLYKHTLDIQFADSDYTNEYWIEFIVYGATSEEANTISKFRNLYDARTPTCIIDTKGGDAVGVGYLTNLLDDSSYPELHGYLGSWTPVNTAFPHIYISDTVTEL